MLSKQTVILSISNIVVILEYFLILSCVIGSVKRNLNQRAKKG